MNKETEAGRGAVGAPVQPSVRPRAWLCELAQEDGTTRTQFVEEDPDGQRVMVKFDAAVAVDGFDGAQEVAVSSQMLRIL